MKEEIEKMYIQALIDDLPPNVFADQVLLLFYRYLINKITQPCDDYENGDCNGTF